MGVLLSCGGLAQATTWTTLDYPGASVTHLTGVSGSKIVGYANGHGIIYDTTAQSWTTLDIQGARQTEIQGIDGSNYAGKYYDSSGEHGFLYDGTNWTTFNVPGDRLDIAGISGRTIAGYYQGNSSDYTKFLYNGTTLTEVPISLGNLSEIYGIDGSNIVGNYFDAYGDYGFLYDGMNVTNINMPGAEWTWAMDIDGDKIVGRSSLGNFLYNRTTNTYTVLDTPVTPRTANGTDGITGIAGNFTVGYYTTAFNSTHGFVGTIPEPATMLLLGFGMMLAGKKLRR